MFGLGFLEILFLAGLGFVVLGPEKFPSVARDFLRTINDLKRSFFEIRSEFDDIRTEVTSDIQDLTSETWQPPLLDKNGLRTEIKNPKQEFIKDFKIREPADHLEKKPLQKETKDSKDSHE